MLLFNINYDLIQLKFNIYNLILFNLIMIRVMQLE